MLLDRVVGYRISPLLVGKGEERLKCRHVCSQLRFASLPIVRRRSTHLSRRSTGVWMPELNVKGERKPLDQRSSTALLNEKMTIHSEQET